MPREPNIVTLGTADSKNSACRIGKIVKERIEYGANEKTVLRFSLTVLSFASISIFPG